MRRERGGCRSGQREKSVLTQSPKHPLPISWGALDLGCEGTRPLTWSLGVCCPGRGHGFGKTALQQRQPSRSDAERCMSSRWALPAAGGLGKEDHVLHSKGGSRQPVPAFPARDHAQASGQVSPQSQQLRSGSCQVTWDKQPQRGVGGEPPTWPCKLRDRWTRSLGPRLRGGLVSPGEHPQWRQEGG